MILRRGTVPTQRDPGVTTENGSDPGGLMQFGADVTTLAPGTTSTERHWHSAEDEFLLVLDGEATVVENDGAHGLGPGDVACWPAGVANAHHVQNRSSADCRYLVVGTRPDVDVCRYPDSGRTLSTDPDTWRIVDDATGRVLRSGATPPYPRVPTAKP